MASAIRFQLFLGWMASRTRSSSKIQNTTWRKYTLARRRTMDRSWTAGIFTLGARWTSSARLPSSSSAISKQPNGISSTAVSWMRWRTPSSRSSRNTRGKPSTRNLPDKATARASARQIYATSCPRWQPLNIEWPNIDLCFLMILLWLSRVCSDRPALSRYEYACIIRLVCDCPISINDLIIDSIWPTYTSTQAIV